MSGNLTGLCLYITVEHVFQTLFSPQKGKDHFFKSRSDINNYIMGPKRE